MPKLPSTLVALVLLIASAHAQQLSPKAPVDKPLQTGAGQQAALDRAIEPYVQQAKATYPAAKQRFYDGLPRGESFFVTIRLRDSRGMHEQVFVAVARIADEKISGKISSQIQLVQGYKLGDSITVSEGDMLDWLIAKPDGSEEGNFVGKFMDTYNPSGA